MITQRAADIRPFIVMDVLEAAQVMERNGEDVIHLEVGEPDFDTPECIKEAGLRALPSIGVSKAHGKASRTEKLALKHSLINISRYTDLLSVFFGAGCGSVPVL